MRATIDWPGTDAATDEAGGLRPGRSGQNKWPKSATYRNRAESPTIPSQPPTGGFWPALLPGPPRVRPAILPHRRALNFASSRRADVPYLGALRENANPLLPFVSLKAMRVGVIEPTTAVDE